MTATHDPARTIDFRYGPSTSWTAICRPDDPYKTLVREDGALLYDLVADRQVWCFTRTISVELRIDQAPILRTQSTEDARTPIVHTIVRYPNAEFEVTTFAHLDAAGRRSDILAWEVRVPDDGPEFLAQVQVTARDRTGLYTGRSAGPSREIFRVEIAQTATPRILDVLLEGTFGQDSTRMPDGPLAFVSTPEPLEPWAAPDFGPVPVLATAGTLLPPGGRQRGAIVVPLNHADADGVDLAWVDAALAAERAFWSSYGLFPKRIEIPDAGIMDMIESCARNILQARETVDGLPEFRVGSAIFRGLWVVDGHFLLETARYIGWDDEARGAVDVLLRRRRADGSIAEMPAHIKETAIALATLVRQSELTGDDDLLKDLWPVVLDGVAHIESLRRDAYALPESSMAHGLLQPAFPDGGIGGMRPEYTSTYWVLGGLGMVADAARRLGFDADAARFQRDYDELMRDFRRLAARDLATLPDGTPYLPTIMPGSGDHTWLADAAGPTPVWRVIHPQTGTWAFAQAIYPGEVFDKDDPLVAGFLHLLDLVDDEQGIPTNTAFWTYRMLWTYSASFYAHAWLAAERPDKAVDYLYAYANHATPTRVWREEQPLRDNPILHLSGDMPHNWASAEFIRLVRHLLVLEWRNRLDLLAGVPDHWLTPGSAIVLEATPTRFGPVTVRTAVDENGDCQVEIERDVTWPRQPAATRLRVPGGFGSVAIAGAATSTGTGDRWIELPAAARQTVVMRPGA